MSGGDVQSALALEFIGARPPFRRPLVRLGIDPRSKNIGAPGGVG